MGEGSGRKQLGQQQGQAGTPRLPASAAAFWSQVTVISCKGAKILRSESLKPMIDACAHTRTHALTLCACVGGWRLSSSEGGHIPLNRVRVSEKALHFIQLHPQLISNPHVCCQSCTCMRCMFGHAHVWVMHMYEVLRTGPWTVCRCPAQAPG